MGKTGKRFLETRMEQGYTLSDVARELDIDVRYLYDLEDEDYDDLPGKTHVLGYAQAYARFLGLSQEQVTAEILAQTGFDEIIPVQDGVEAQLFNPEQKKQARDRSLAQFYRSAAKERRYMALLIVSFVLCGVISLLGFLL